MAAEAIRVIGAAMAEAGVAGIGRLTLSRRERMVMVEPRGTGMVLITLRAADEVRAPQFTSVDSAIDAEMLAIARAIIAQRVAKLVPRPLPGGVAGTNRGQNEGGRYETASGFDAGARDRSDGGPETQPCAGGAVREGLCGQKRQQGGA
jgi:hypothetical protein